LAQNYQLPIFIHLYSKKETFKLAEFVKSNQDIVFIIGHLMGIEIFKNYKQYLKNVYFDTSGGYVIKKEHLRYAITLFGSDHIIFGSDMPFERIGDQINKINSIDLSAIERENIFRKNALKVLRLDIGK